MEQYEQPILISYAEEVKQVKYKHRINYKIFGYGLISAVSLTMFVFSIYNLMQIFF